jgi:hypothetical protein
MAVFVMYRALNWVAVLGALDWQCRFARILRIVMTSAGVACCVKLIVSLMTLFSELGLACNAFGGQFV